MKKNSTKYFIIQRIREKESEREKKRDKRKRYKGEKNCLPNSEIKSPRKYRRNQRTNFLKDSFYSNKKSKVFHKKTSYIQKHLPPNLNYLVHNQESPFNINEIIKEKYESNGKIEIPEYFSIIEHPKESFNALRRVISALLIEDNGSVIFDYAKCKKVGLGTQVLLDIILLDFLSFTNKCQRIDRDRINYFPNQIGGENIDAEDVKKIIFSVGSPVTLNVNEKNFPDIVKYKLCIHDNEKEKNRLMRINQKNIDTTEMVDYVNDCLKRMKKELSKEKLDDLSTVIGEILINAEEHSTTKHRFSIGYFKEEVNGDDHIGIFRLVILNFGKTIYEKFKFGDCPNPQIVNRMNELSKSYTRRNLFFQKDFEEENLWTLYALQEGVTSIPPDKYKRGNGSIRFIDSFFNIKGTKTVDNISKMIILSGKTQITFDGSYMIMPKINSKGEAFKVMTFNDSGNIEDKPDSKYVCCMDNYFPGTMISVRLLFNDDDIKILNN